MKKGDFYTSVSRNEQTLVKREPLVTSIFSSLREDVLGDVHQVVVVEQVHAVLPLYLRQGYSIVVEPYEHTEGMCTLLQNEDGTRVGLIDLEQRGAVEPVEGTRTVRGAEHRQDFVSS